MSFQAVLDAVGPEGVALMLVSFIAVVWWGFRRRPRGDEDPPWPGEDEQ